MSIGRKELFPVNFANSTPSSIMGWNAAGEPINITLGTNLSLAGSVLNASGGGGGGITNGALVNELTMSPGGGGNLVSSNIYKFNNASLQLGLDSVAGNRAIRVNTSDAQASLILQPKANGARGNVLTLNSGFLLQYSESTPKAFYKIANWGNSTNTWSARGEQGSYQISLFTGEDGTDLTDTIMTVRLIAQAITDDGSKGYSVMKIYTFLKDGTANPVQIGATSVLHEIDTTTSSGTPSVDIVPNGAAMAIDWTTGTASFLTMTWSFFVEIATSSYVP